MTHSITGTEIALCLFLVIIVALIVVVVIMALVQESREWMIDRYDLYCFKKRMKHWYNYQLSFRDRRGIVNAVITFNEDTLMKHFYNAGAPLTEEHLKYFFNSLFACMDMERNYDKGEKWVLSRALNISYKYALHKIGKFASVLADMGYLEKEQQDYTLNLQIEYIKKNYSDKIENNCLCISKKYLPFEEAAKYGITFDKWYYVCIQIGQILICKQGQKKSIITGLGGDDFLEVKNDVLNEIVELI